ELADVQSLPASPGPKEEVVKWRTMAAGADCAYPAAALEASRAYQNGVGTPGNGEEAFRLGQQAAPCGGGRGWGMLGLLYQRGVGTKANPQEAARSFRVGADLGDPAAQFQLAGLYQQGRGVERNYQMAAKWYTKVAPQRVFFEKGQACLRLGDLYQS